MATFYHGSLASVFINGFDVTTFVGEANVDASIDTAEVTCLRAVDKAYIQGLEDAKLSMSGFYDHDATYALTFHAAMEAIRAGRISVPVLYAPYSYSFGESVFQASGVLTAFKVGTGISDAGKLDLDFQASKMSNGTSSFLESKLLNTYGAFTTTANGVSIDNTTSTAFGGVGMIQISAVSGTTPTIVGKIQHSVDNSVWVDLITFSSANSVSAQVSSVTGTVNRYVRGQWTIAGTSPSFTFSLAFGRLYV